MEHKIIIDDLSGLEEAAATFIREIGDNRLIALYGKMGAGKTTFATAVCRCLGVEGDAMGSPTFAIVNEYRRPSGEPIFHFDFYRIEKIEDALDIGFYDYIDSGFLCIMEWPENIEGILPEETLRVHIDVGHNGSRIISWTD